MGEELVLVTGGSGFIGAHCIAQLADAGYQVRTTVRSLAREPDVRAMLRRGGSEPDDRLSFVAADLMGDAGWREAMDGVSYVLHVASPFPTGVPKDENELIVPARDGALRVLHAAKATGVKRVVLTSSFAAIGYGPAPKGKVFTEDDWTDPGSREISAYVKSKTVAEIAAWDYIESEGEGLEMSVVNPVGVLGPVLGADLSTSIQLVSRLLDGSTPGLPKLSFNIVDVRDVADLHLRAMTAPVASGERFLAVTGGPVSMADIARLLRSQLGDRAKKAPVRVLPNWAVKLVAIFDRSLKQIVPDLGKVRPASNQKALTMLDWQPRSGDEAVVATAESLLALGIVAS